MWYVSCRKIRLSAHGANRHQYHFVWIPKYRQRILKGELILFALFIKQGGIELKQINIAILNYCVISLSIIHSKTQN